MVSSSGCDLREILICVVCFSANRWKVYVIDCVVFAGELRDDLLKTYGSRSSSIFSLSFRSDLKLLAASTSSLVDVGCLKCVTSEQLCNIVPGAI